MEYDLSDITGIASGFEYRNLCRLMTEEELERLYEKLRLRFRKSKSEPESVETWMVRSYSSVKLLLAASVMMSSAEYADLHGLTIVVPYLLYYSLFNVSRAFLLLVPEEEWKDGKLLDEMTHQKAWKAATSHLTPVNREFSSEYSALMKNALAAREIFSYKFPAEGLGGEAGKLIPSFEVAIKTCSVVGEVAQFYSEALEREFADLQKPANEMMALPLRRYCEYEHKHIGTILDEDDYYRLWHAMRKMGQPVSLVVTATEGLVEDFFGAWRNDYGDEAYNPDLNWKIIFPFE